MTEGSPRPVGEPRGDLRGEAYVALLAPIWSYLSVRQAPVDADVVFAFGCANLSVPQPAANLMLDGLAPHVLVSGGVGRRAGELYGSSETAVFSRHLEWLGVPPEAVVAEDRAANTGENVTLGMGALARRGIGVRRALLVASRLLAELDRLDSYAALGFIAPEPPPPVAVAEAAAGVRRLLGAPDALPRHVPGEAAPVAASGVTPAA